MDPAIAQQLWIWSGRSSSRSSSARHDTAGPSSRPAPIRSPVAPTKPALRRRCRPGHRSCECAVSQRRYRRVRGRRQCLGHPVTAARGGHTDQHPVHPDRHVRKGNRGRRHEADRHIYPGERRCRLLATLRGAEGTGRAPRAVQAGPGSIAHARSKVAARLRAKFEIVRAEAGLSGRLEDMISAETAVRDRERDLKRIMNRKDMPLNSGRRLFR